MVDNAVDPVVEMHRRCNSPETILSTVVAGLLSIAFGISRGGKTALITALVFVTIIAAVVGTMMVLSRLSDENTTLNSD